MEFGIQYFPVNTPKTFAPAYFEESILLAAEAESIGFAHARVVEHYFENYGGLTPNPLIFLTAIAQRTKRMRLITGAILPVFNNPLKVAGEIGMVDAISNGRLDIGLARAFLLHEFRRFGISPDESYARYLEGIEQIELLLTKENVTHKGRFHSFENITSLPRPTQKPRPKFYVAATQTPETFEYAGRKGYSLMAIPIGSIKPLLEIYRKAWRDAGHAGNGEVMVAFHMFCHDDAQRARDLCRSAFDLYFSELAYCAGEWARDQVVSKDYRDYEKATAKFASITLESQIDSGGAWVGTPIQIIEQINNSIEAIGAFEHASLQVNFGDLAYPVARSSLQLFGTQVLPHFRTSAMSAA